MKPMIIPIPRASEQTIKALIDAGILKVTADGLKVKETTLTPTKAKGLQH